MFSFLNSGILAVAAAAVIPLIIYLFAKKKPQKVIFSSIRHILQTQKSEKRKINLQDILLLMIRTLIILLTILAISRPTINLPWIKSSASHPKTAVAIVLDNSYSMNYLVDTETEFAKAKQIVNQINQQISASDAAVLFTLDDNWNQLNSFLNYGKLPAEKIQNVKLTADPMDFGSVLQTASKLIKKSHYSNREIYVISDLQQKEIPKLEEQILYIPVSQVTDPINISCQKASFQADIVDNDYKVTAELVNHSDYEQKDIVYSLFLNGATVSEKVTNLQPKQTKKVEFQLQLTTPGSYTGYINVREERLTYDNRSYFSFKFTPEPSTILLTDHPVPSALKAFLSVYTSNFIIQNLEEYNEAELLACDNLLVALSYCSQRTDLLLQKLAEINKNYLFLTNAELSDNCREIILEEFNTKTLGFTREETLISDVDKFHPVVKMLENKSLAPLRNYWQTETNARVILAGSNWPLAVENNGNILILFELTKANSQFLVNSAFPIFMNNSLQFTQLQNSYNRQLKLGSAFKVQADEIVLPDGNKLETKQDLYYTSQPGIYTTASRKYAVNLKYSESDFKEIEFPKYIKVLNENWPQQIFTSRYGYEIWKLILIVVLLLFIWEMLLVKKRENR